MLNRECVRKAALATLSLGATVNRWSEFERKHYFYADLPLGYQITQQRSCIGSEGELVLQVPKTRDNARRFDMYEKRVRIDGSDRTGQEPARL